MYGYYPFGKDVTFEIELNQVINQTMENDIPQYANMNVSTGRKLKQLLMIIQKVFHLNLSCKSLLIL